MNGFQKKIEEIVRTRSGHLEVYCAAFIKEVGSKEASKYSLIEERSDDGRKIIWYFEKRS